MSTPAPTASRNARRNASRRRRNQIAHLKHELEVVTEKWGEVSDANRLLSAEHLELQVDYHNDRYDFETQIRTQQEEIKAQKAKISDQQGKIYDYQKDLDHQIPRESWLLNRVEELEREVAALKLRLRIQDYGW